ncbi:MAG: hypothetical protein N4A45_00730 [Flavobacteriales bacterium]|nr:hypothetical protein [Flavobacteriales bacterium]
MLLLAIHSIIYAQVGMGTISPHVSAILDIESTNKGFLPPRLTEAERNAIVNPAQGLLIYNSTKKCLEVYTATGGGNNTADWQSLCSGSGGGGVSPTAPNNPSGSLSLSTQTCFDIAESNDFSATCGSLALRANFKSDFSQQATYEQTITIRTTIAVTDLALVAVNVVGDVIQSISQPTLTNLTASGPNSTTTATITYRQDLNTTALGTTTINAFVADIYLTYKEQGVDKQNKISTTVKDCDCNKITSACGWTSVYVNNLGEVYSTGLTGGGAAGRGVNGGPIPHSDFEKINFPNHNGNVAQIVETSNGNSHTLALDAQGIVYGFGSSILGELGLPDSFYLTPVVISNFLPANEKVIQVSAGWATSYLLTNNHKIYRTGAGAYGQLGNQSTDNIATFQHLDLDDDYYKNQNNGQVPIPISIFATRERAFFIDQNNKIWATGRRLYGGTGLSNPLDYRRFGKVEGVADPSVNKRLPQNYQVAQLTATATNTVVLLTDGSLYVAGHGAAGISGAVSNTGAQHVEHFEEIQKDPTGALNYSTANIVRIYLANNYDNARSRLFVLTSDNKLYMRGSNFHFAGGVQNPVPGIAGFNKFVEVNLSALNGSRVRSIKTLEWVTGLITEDGKIYTAGATTYNNLMRTVDTTKHAFRPAEFPNAINNTWVH